MSWAWVYPAVIGFWLLMLVIAVVIVGRRESWMEKARQRASHQPQ